MTGSSGSAPEGLEAPQRLDRVYLARTRQASRAHIAPYSTFAQARQAQHLTDITLLIELRLELCPVFPLDSTQVPRNTPAPCNLDHFGGIHQPQISNKNLSWPVKFFQCLSKSFKTPFGASMVLRL